MEPKNFNVLSVLTIYQNYDKRLKQLNDLAVKTRNKAGNIIPTDYGKDYYNEDLLYLQAKTYKLLPENHQKNFIKNNLTNIQRTALNNLITNSVVNPRNSLDNFIKNKEIFYKNNGNNDFIFNGKEAPEVKAYKNAVMIEEIDEEDEELENDFRELMESNNPLAGASSDPKPSTSRTPPPIRPKLSSPSPTLSYDQIYKNYQERKNQLNELVKNNPQHAGDANQNDLFYLNAKTYLSLPDDTAREKFLREGIIDGIVKNQIKNHLGPDIAFDESGKSYEADKFVRLKYSVTQREQLYNMNNKTKPFIFNPAVKPQPIEPYLPKPIEKPSSTPPRATTPPQAQSTISNKRQVSPQEQIILNAYNIEVGKIKGNDPDRLEYLQLKTYQALSNLKNTSEEKFVQQLNTDGSGNKEALRKINDGFNINEEVQFMEGNDMHHGVYGDRPFNPLATSKSTPGQKNPNQKSKLSNPSTPSVTQPSSTFNLNDNNGFQKPSKTGQTTQKRRLNSVGSSSESDDESDDENDNITNQSRRLSTSSMNQATAAAQKILNAKNVPGTGTQQKSVNQQYKDEAERMVNQFSTYTNDVFEAARNNYFTPPPAPPAPPAGTPPPPNPTDPKDLYPIFTFSPYEGKVDLLDPNKKPSDINYTFKRQGENEFDMNSKDAKSLTENITNISFEKSNEAFIMTLKFKSAISNDSVAMINMINELHKIKGLSSHYNNITMTLTLTFSSKAMVEKLLKDLTNNNKDKDGKLEQKEFKELYGNIFKKFSDNAQVVNLLKQEYKIIDDQAKADLERDLNLDNTKGVTGLLAIIMSNPPMNAIINPQQRQIIEMDGKQKISANYQEKVRIKKSITELNLFKNVLLNGSGPKGTNFDSILKETLIEKVAAGIFDKFGEIFGAVGKHGLKMNETEIKNFVRGELESYNKSSINPMIAYANEKVTLNDLRDIKTVILREIDEQIEKEKEKLGKNLAEQAAIPLQLSDIMKKMQTQAIGSRAPGM